MDVNIWVDACVDANFDGLTNERTYERTMTNGRKSGPLYRAMLQAGATKTVIAFLLLSQTLISGAPKNAPHLGVSN